jgi:hypothetical protein
MIPSQQEPHSCDKALCFKHAVSGTDDRTSDMPGFDNEGMCTSTFSTPVTAYRAIDTDAVNSPANQSPNTSRVATATANSTILSYGTEYVAPLLLVWQETDLSHFDKDYASALAQRLNINFQPTATGSVIAATASTTSGVTAVTPISTAVSQPDPPTTSTSVLSTGAKAGIGIAAVVGVVFLAVASFLLYKKVFRRQTKLNRESFLQNEQPELVQAKVPEAAA